MAIEMQKTNDQVAPVGGDMADRSAIADQLLAILARLDSHPGADIAAIHVHHALNAIEEMDKLGTASDAGSNSDGTSAKD